MAARFRAAGFGLTAFNIGSHVREGSVESRVSTPSFGATPRGSVAPRDGSGTGSVTQLSGGSSQDGAEDDEEGQSEAQIQERDRLLHWWCMNQMPRCLYQLRRLPEVGPFLEPLPWEEIGLLDYPEVIECPMDLRTIEQMLVTGEYNDEDGLINPELFWEDIMLCFENCRDYYDDDPEIEAVQMAFAMLDEAEELEDEFWDELQNFEASIAQVDPTLGTVAAVADVAATAVGDAAVTAIEQTNAALDKLKAWWLGGSDETTTTPTPEMKVVGTFSLNHEERPSLRWHFDLVLRHYYHAQAGDDIQDIQQEVDTAFDKRWPELLAKLGPIDEEDVEEWSKWDGAHLKKPMDELMPQHSGRAWRSGAVTPTGTGSSAVGTMSLGALRNWRGGATSASQQARRSSAAVTAVTAPGSDEKASSHRSSISRLSQRSSVSMISRDVSRVSFGTESALPLGPEGAESTPNIEAFRKMMPHRAHSNASLGAGPVQSDGTHSPRPSARPSTRSTTASTRPNRLRRQLSEVRKDPQNQES